MADQLMTTTELAAIIPEIWGSSFYDALLEGIVFNDVISSDYEGDIQSLGDRVHINQVPQFDLASDLPEGAKSDADSVSLTQQDLVINKRTVKDYIITARAERQSIEHSNKLRELAFHSIMKKMQVDIIAATIPSAAAPDHQISYDSGTTLALADILEAKELLDDADVPDDGLRCMILGSAQWNDLFNITGFTSRDFIPAGSPLTSGSFATNLLGFRPKFTTEAGAVARLFHPQYMSMAVQSQLSVKVFDQGVQGTRAMRVNADLLWGLKQLDDQRVVSIS